MRRLLVILWLLVAGLCAGGFPGAMATPPPAPQRWVTDGPGMLSAAARDRLDRRLQAYEKGTGHQVLVWIGNSTGGVPIEEWAVQAFAAWKVGRKGLDDGVALFIFAKDRTLRIEVGYGLEGQIPDVVAARIIRETIVPRLKRGDPDAAVSAGVERILNAAGGDAAAAEAAPDRSAGPPPGPLGWIILSVLGLGLLILVVTHPGLAVFMLFSVLSGGRRGGGGFGGGGGGFSGGGGSSGGGGASGSW
jgi:uncharacterized protein